MEKDPKLGKFLHSLIEYSVLYRNDLTVDGEKVDAAVKRLDDGSTLTVRACIPAHNISDVSETIR